MDNDLELPQDADEGKLWWEEEFDEEPQCKACGIQLSEKEAEYCEGYCSQCL